VGINTLPIENKLLDKVDKKVFTLLYTIFPLIATQKKYIENTYEKYVLGVRSYRDADCRL